MSYDLAVWPGPMPADAASADEEFERRMAAMEEALANGGPTPPPASELIAFVEAALERFPPLTHDSGDECPWASAPLQGEIVGDLLYFPLTHTGAGFARDELAGIAAAAGLVCYDPQEGKLLLRADEPGAPVRRGRLGRLFRRGQ